MSMWSLEHFRFESLPADLLNLWSRLVIMQLDYFIVISCLDAYNYSCGDLNIFGLKLLPW